MLMFKRGQLGGFVVLFWAIVVISIILVFFTLGASLIKTFGEKDVGVKVIENLEIDSYMDNFERYIEGWPLVYFFDENIICVVDSVNRVLNGPCACPSGEDLFVIDEGLDVDLGDCLMDDYCYYGETGCSVINENYL